MSSYRVTLVVRFSELDGLVYEKPNNSNADCEGDDVAKHTFNIYIGEKSVCLSRLPTTVIVGL